MAIDIIL